LFIVRSFNDLAHRGEELLSRYFYEFRKAGAMRAIDKVAAISIARKVISSQLRKRVADLFSILGKFLYGGVRPCRGDRVTVDGSARRRSDHGPKIGWAFLLGMVL
jgi:hypothetical protein